LAGVPAGSPEWAAIARASADTLARVAAVAEPAGTGPVSRAADILARSASPRRGGPALVASGVADQLAQVSSALVMTGAARDGGEAVLLLTVVVAAARLAVRLAELHMAQQQLRAAGAAREAAARLLPLVSRTAESGILARALAEPPGRAEAAGTGQRPAVRRGEDRGRGTGPEAGR